MLTGAIRIAIGFCYWVWKEGRTQKILEMPRNIRRFKFTP